MLFGLNKARKFCSSEICRGSLWRYKFKTNHLQICFYIESILTAMLPGMWYGNFLK